MKREYSLSGINTARGADELILYRGTERTGTNAYGCEVPVLNGIAGDCRGGNSAVPDGGYVLSGHGKAALFLREAILPGALVELDEKNMSVSVTYEEVQKSAGMSAQIDLLISRAKGKELPIRELKELLEHKEYDLLEKKLEDCYYLTADCVTNETRAVWHRAPLNDTPEKVDKRVRELSEAGINLILIESIYDGISIGKRSSFVPVRWDLEDKDYDLLDAYISSGKKYGIEIHAWIEDFFIGAKSIDKRTESGSYLADKYPDWVAKKRDGTIYMTGEPEFIYFNAAMPEVREFLCDMYSQLLDEYDFTGLQLDYIRYPLTSSIDDTVGFDDFSVSEFMKKTNINVREINSVDSKEWRKYNEWRAENVSIYVKMIRDMVDKKCEHGRKIELSSAVFGNPDEAIRLKSQNWLHWVQMGWLDRIYPMAYYHHPDDVYNEVKAMRDRFPDMPLTAGIAPLYNRQPDIALTQQIEASRRAGSDGAAVFESSGISGARVDQLKKGVFRS